MTEFHGLQFAGTLRAQEDDGGIHLLNCPLQGILEPATWWNLLYVHPRAQAASFQSFGDDKDGEFVEAVVCHEDVVILECAREACLWRRMWWR